MATYDLSHGGRPQAWGNVGFAMLPSTEVGPYEFMEAAAHFRPTSFTINRYLWFADHGRMEPEATGSPALMHFLRNLRASGGDIMVGDKLKIITLPIDHVVERIFVRNDAEAAGFSFDLTIEDKDGNVVFEVGSYDLTLPHLHTNGANPPLITENFNLPVWVPAISAAQQAELTDQAEALVANLMVRLDAANASLTAAQNASTAADGDEGATVTADEQLAIDAAQDQVDTLTAQLAAAQAELADVPTATATSGYGMYLGHNHELVLTFTAIPAGRTVDDVKVRVAAQVNNPWLGAW